MDDVIVGDMLELAVVLIVKCANWCVWVGTVFQKHNNVGC